MQIELEALRRESGVHVEARRAQLRESLHAKQVCCRALICKRGGVRGGVEALRRESGVHVDATRAQLRESLHAKQVCT
jgi:hypothetical protein